MDDRRRFPRVRAPILCRPRGGFFKKVERPVENVSLGGVRVWSDEPREVGERLSLELLLPDGPPLEIPGQVAWVERTGEGAPARYDVGIAFVKLPAEGLARLERVLEPER